MSIELDLAGINTLSSLLERLPLGTEARRIAERIAVWTTNAHKDLAVDRKQFPKTLSNVPDDTLSDVYAYWNSELIRLHELTGLLEGQRKLLELSVKKEKALARGRLRNEYENLLKESSRAAAEDETPTSKPPKPPKPTVGELNDRAEEDPKVLETVETLALIDMVMSSVDGYRDGCLVATTSLSREISFRQAQYQARLR